MRLLIILLLLFSCSKNSMDGESGDNSVDNDAINFEVNLSVASSGNPLDDVSIYMRYDYVYGEGGLVITSNETPPSSLLEQNYPNPFNPSTTFNIPDGIIDLSIYDINDNFIVNLLSDFECQNYHCKVDNSNAIQILLEYTPLGFQLFKYVMTVDNQSSNFNYMFFMPGVDLEQIDVIGTTNEEGKLDINELIWFPHLYSMPAMECRDEFNNMHGHFSISDIINNNIQIIVEYNGTKKSFNAQINSGINDIHLIWEDGEQLN